MRLQNNPFHTNLFEKSCFLFYKTVHCHILSRKVWIITTFIKNTVNTIYLKFRKKEKHFFSTEFDVAPVDGTEIHVTNHLPAYVAPDCKHRERQTCPEVQTTRDVTQRHTVHDSGFFGKSDEWKTGIPWKLMSTVNKVQNRVIANGLQKHTSATTVVSLQYTLEVPLFLYVLYKEGSFPLENRTPYVRFHSKAVCNEIIFNLRAGFQYGHNYLPSNLKTSHFVNYFDTTVNFALQSYY